jgi:hypothetical protein
VDRWSEDTRRTIVDVVGFEFSTYVRPRRAPTRRRAPSAVRSTSRFFCPNIAVVQGFVVDARRALVFHLDAQ